MQFFAAFIQILVHSIWQAALLCSAYFLLNKIFKNTHPLQKRNLLYILLIGQVFISIVGIFILMNHNEIGFASFTLQSQQWFDKYAVIISYTYFVIVGSKFCYTFYQWKMFKLNYKQQLKNPSADIKIFADLKAKQLEIKKTISIFYSKYVKIPITFGFIKPIILLPFSLSTTLSIDELEAIIIHELIHIKSNDFILNWITIVIETIFFFNPFIKIITSNIKLEREKNCDVTVLQFKYNSIIYADTLLKIATNNQDLKLFQIGIINKKNQLLKRILFFSNLDNISFSHKKIISPITALFFLITIFISTYIFSSKKTIPENKLSTSNMLVENYVAVKNKENKIISIKNLAPKKAKVTTFNRKKNNKSSLNKPEPVDDYFLDKNLLTAVNFKEEPDSIKTFLYNIETQKGKMWQNYKLTKHNGKWHLQPQWMMVESYDTTLHKIDTLVNSIDSIQ